MRISLQVPVTKSWFFLARLIPVLYPKPLLPLSFSFLFRGVFASRNCWNMGLSQLKVFISQLVTTLGVWDLGVALSLSQSELLSTNTMFGVDILQLPRTVSQKQNYRNPKSKVSTFRDVSRTTGLGGLGLCFSFVRWGSLHVRFNGLNGTSIIESVVVRSGTCYSPCL